jgi:drug/metabolite transporter (DMT)-like permease
MQTEIMIVGEMLCLFAYLLFGDKEEKQGSKPQPPILICLIPMYMDLLATTLEFIAVNYISGSVFSITSSVVIVSSAVFTKVLLRTNFNSYQIAGCILTILGMIITGYG